MEGGEKAKRGGKKGRGGREKERMRRRGREEKKMELINGDRESLEISLLDVSSACRVRLLACLCSRPSCLAAESL